MYHPRLMLSSNQCSGLAMHQDSSQLVMFTVSYVHSQFSYVHTLPGEGRKVTLPEGDRKCFPAITTPVKAIRMKLRGKVDIYINYLNCKFSDPRSLFLGSNNVIIAKYSRLSEKSTGLQLNYSGAQTKNDNDNRQKQKIRNETANLKCGPRFDPRSTV